MKLIGKFVDFKTLQFPQWLEVPDFENWGTLQKNIDKFIN